MLPLAKLVLVHNKFGLEISDCVEATSIVDGEYERSCPTWYYVFSNVTDVVSNKSCYRKKRLHSAF